MELTPRNPRSFPGCSGRPRPAESPAGPAAAPAPRSLFVRDPPAPRRSPGGGNPSLPHPISPKSIPSHPISSRPFPGRPAAHILRSPCPAPALPAEITALPAAVPAAKMAEGAGEERAPRCRRQGRPMLPPSLPP